MHFQKCHDECAEEDVHQNMNLNTEIIQFRVRLCSILE